MIYKKVGVIGLGYVGLPLVKRLIEKNFDVIGFDINSKKVKKIAKLKTYKNAKITSNSGDLRDRNFFIICVPTPINKKKKPDLNPLKLASQIVGKNLDKKNIVVYESTVYPGCTEEFCVPILEKYSGLKFNKNFFCGYSPERINPEDKKHTLENIIKITSGSNLFSANKIDKFYKKLIPAGTFQAESIKIAEAAKIIENVQRDLNIALVNELSLIFDKMKLDTFKVLKAAETKWNFISFKPGLVGGHCIGVDPYYLTYKSQKLRYKPKIILAGRKVNDNMPNEVSKKLLNDLKKDNTNIKNKKVLIIGYSFKENSKDIRNTKVLNLYNNLKRNINLVDIYDPIVDTDEIFKKHKIIVKNKLSKKNYYDALVLAVPHDVIIKKEKNIIKKVLKKKNYIIDIKNAL